MIKRFFSSQPNYPPITAVLIKHFDKKTILALSAETVQSELIEVTANYFKCDCGRLLEIVAKELGVSSSNELKILPLSTYANLQLDHNLLRTREMILHRNIQSKSGISLLFADPEKIDIVSFQKAGFSIKLTLGSTVKKGWTSLNKLESISNDKLSTDQLSEILKLLLNKANSFGAAEIIIDPENFQYHFNSRDLVEYRGSLSANVVEAICSLVNISNATASIRHLDETISLEKNATSQNILISLGNKNRPTLTVKPSSSPSPSQNRKVAIIDDDQRFSTILSHIISSKGFTISRYNSALSALSEILAGRIDSSTLLLCDVHLAQLDGVEFVKQLRSSGFDHQIIMFTSDRDQLLEAELALLGIDAFVTKNTDSRVLLAWIENLFSKRLRPGSTLQSTPQTTAKEVADGVC